MWRDERWEQRWWKRNENIFWVKCLFAMCGVQLKYFKIKFRCAYVISLQTIRRTITFEWQSWCQLLLCGMVPVWCDWLIYANAMRIQYEQIYIQIQDHCWELCVCICQMMETKLPSISLELFENVGFSHHIRCEMASRQCQNYKIWSQSRSFVVIYFVP